jgi:nucleotide-binding universal stress UspA family protein
MKATIPLTNILVPVDKSDSSLISQEAAALVAKKTEAEVTIFHVIPSSVSYGKVESQVASSYIPSTVEEKVLRGRELEMSRLEGLYKEGEGIVEEARALFEEEHVNAKSEVLREDDVAGTIVDYSKDFDLTVIGAHGENEKDLYALGSVTKKIIRQTQCPTLIVKKASAFLKMLVCLDGSDYSIRALNYASALAEKMGSKITLLNVSESGMRKKTSSAVKELGSQVLANSPYATGLSGLKFERIVEYGFQPDVIAEVAQKGTFDLIVVGRKGLRKTKVFSRGSVVDEVATKAKCPVLIVPNEE